MKKSIWMAAGIAGMLLGTPQIEAHAAVSVHINVGGSPSFVINTWPEFIYLPDQGFSVAANSPYDIVYYQGYYFVYHNGYWYRARYNRGPWTIVVSNRIPYGIRRHRWEDIRRYRDVEYRRRHPDYDRGNRNDNRTPDRRGQRIENTPPPVNRGQRIEGTQPPAVRRPGLQNGPQPVNRGQQIQAAPQARPEAGKGQRTEGAAPPAARGQGVQRGPQPENRGQRIQGAPQAKPEAVKEDKNKNEKGDKGDGSNRGNVPR